MKREKPWMSRFLIGCAALLAVSASIAGGGSGTQVLDSSKVRVDGIVMFRGASLDWANPDGCTRSDWVILSPMHAYYREIYAALLTAYTMSSEVSFWLSGCLAAGNDTYPLISSITVR